MQAELFPQADPQENILPYEGQVEFYPELFGPEESMRYFMDLKNKIQWKQEPIKIMGKEIMQPRLTAWYGEEEKPYRYSGITMEAKPWTSFLLEIKRGIEKKARVHFTSALLNYYRDGQDSMGWHRDNEKELGPEPIIGSVSFGVSRNFQFRHYKDKKPLINVALPPGSGLIMRGLTNRYWEHRIPKTSRINSARINLTFRVIS